MTPEDRKALAKIIKDNPLTEVILSEMETDAIERCVNAPWADDKKRLISSMEVHAIRDFRAKLEEALQDNLPRKNAPA